MDRESPYCCRPAAMDLTGLFFVALLLPCAAYVGLGMAMDGGRGDMWPILAGFVAAQACNSLIHPFSLSDPLFTNTLVSLIHSAFIGFSVAGILGWQWWRKEGYNSAWSHEELFYGAWGGAHAFLCFSSGYFVYDQMDMLRRRLYDPLAPWPLLHHAVLLVCFNMALIRRVAINYLIATLVCELHSMFLHLRRVLRMAGLREDGSWLVKIEWGLHWFTFLTSRLSMHIFITIKVLLDASKFPSGIEWPLAILGILGLDVLNVILGLDLYKAFQRERSVWRKQEKLA